MTSAAHKRGRFRAFLVGFCVYLVANLVWGVVSAILIPEDFFEGGMFYVHTLVWVGCIGTGVAAGQWYLARFRSIHGIETGRRVDTGALEGSLSPGAQADLDGCLTTALRFAESSLRQNGEFAPFAVTMSNDGEQAMHRGDTDTEAIRARLRSQAALLRCVAVGAHDPEAKAIVVTIEHSTGPSMAAHVAYSGEKRRLALSDPQITQTEPHVFGTIGGTPGPKQ